MKYSDCFLCMLFHGIELCYHKIFRIWCSHMKDHVNEERERKKKAIFDGMSPRRRLRILEKVGYENWDPFQEPKYPIDLREQNTKQKAMALSREFLEDCGIKDCSDEYIKAVREISRGLVRGEERYRAMFEFCCWYHDEKGKDESRR